MRCMRPDPDDPNKVAVIIDQAQNHIEHGLPDTIHRWSLEPNIKRDRNINTDLTNCPACGELIPVNAKVCPFCKFVIDEDSAADSDSSGEEEPTDEEKADLNDIGILTDYSSEQPEDSQSAQSVIHKPTTPEEFAAIAKERHYKKGWVVIQSIKHAKSLDDFRRIAEVCRYKPGWAWYQWQELKQQKQKA